MHGRAGHVTKSEVLLAEFNEIFFYFFIERCWCGAPVTAGDWRLRAVATLALGIPSLVGGGKLSQTSDRLGFGVSSDKFGKPINFRPQKRSTVSFGSNLPLMASSSQSLPDPQRNPR